MKTDVAGVLIDNLSKEQVLEKLLNSIKSGGAYAVTPYSELILFAIQNPQYREILNGASISIADGIGVLWAAKFLSLQASNSVQIVGQLIYTLLAVLFNPKYIRSVIQARITGSRIVYDLAKLAAENNYSVALVGGEGGVAQKAADKLQALNPSLKINLAISDMPFDNHLVEKISTSNSDILLIAYSPPKQETWLAQNIQRLNIRLGIGLGGTFDYLAAKRSPAPEIMHYMGLEWFWRLITQPHRWRRMWNAVPVFIWEIFRYKINKI